MIPTIIAIWQLWGLFGQSCDVHVAPLVVGGLKVGGHMHTHIHTCFSVMISKFFSYLKIIFIVYVACEV